MKKVLYFVGVMFLKIYASMIYTAVAW